MDFDQACIDTLLGRGKDLVSFGDLDLIFKVTPSSRAALKCPKLDFQCVIF